VTDTLIDPETGGTELALLAKPTRMGAKKDIAFVATDLKSRDAVICRLVPEPALDFETMADSEIHA